MADVAPGPNQAAINLARWRQDPRLFVREVFSVTPEPWQDEALAAFPVNPRLAFQSAAGTGKTAVLAWLAWNFLLTRPNPSIGVTSISGANLKMNLWRELAYWRDKSPLLQQAFDQTGGEIYAREKPRTWKLEARTWARDATPDQIGNALRGIHAPYVMWLLDETGGYPDAILPVCENIFSGNPVEAHIVQAGNPTHLSGPLYRACTTARKYWYVIQITGDPDDPKRSSRVSIEFARQQIEQYGRNNPFVLVNILGQFPPSSFNVLIGPDEVREAMQRFYREFEIGNAPKLLGVDVARYGDDQSVTARRWGIQMLPFKKQRNIDSTTGAGWVAREWDEWGADACFVDDTGGYGAGWIDQLRQIGKSPIGVGYGKEPHDKAKFANKRAEMAWDFVEWIKRGGALPDDPMLLSALTQTEYTFTPKGQLILEPKADVKKKLSGYSPDEFDAAINTFAEVVSPKSRRRSGRSVSAVPGDYDPFHDLPSQRPEQYR